MKQPTIYREVRTNLVYRWFCVFVDSGRTVLTSDGNIYVFQTTICLYVFFSIYLRQMDAADYCHYSTYSQLIFCFLPDLSEIPYERKLQSRGLVRFLPVMLRSLPELYRNHIWVDVAFVPVSVPDEQGYCGLGISNYAWRTIFENARTVVFEINERLSRLQGVEGSHRVHLSEADYIVEGEHEPLPVRSYKEASEVDKRIAELVVAEIPDGVLLSLGVGGVPFTVANMITQSDLKDIGCHTGTISDAFLALHRAGKLTNACKEVDRGLSTWNLAMGSQELYDWLDAEPQLFHPGDLDYVQNP